MASKLGRYVVGLIGAGIGLSLSPALHEREADELGLRYAYQLLDIDTLGVAAGDVGELVHQARRMGFAGLNVTHPCKQAVVEHLDELSGVAGTLGAVNTVVFTGGRAVGHNTDGYGFAEGFVRGLPGAPRAQVVLLGAGGAGAAVARALVGLGAKRLTIVDVEPGRAARLATALAESHPLADPHSTVVAGAADELPELLRTADGLVNATPVGMSPHGGIPLSPGLLRSDMWVADIVYRPLQTELLRHARERGCPTLHGGAMVVFQAAEAFRLFTGTAPDADRMYRHFAALTAGAGDALAAGGTADA
jgi:shikimate dehydrogenase